MQGLKSLFLSLSFSLSLTHTHRWHNISKKLPPSSNPAKTNCNPFEHRPNAKYYYWNYFVHNGTSSCCFLKDLGEFHARKREIKNNYISLKQLMRSSMIRAFIEVRSLCKHSCRDLQKEITYYYFPALDMHVIFVVFKPSVIQKLSKGDWWFQTGISPEYPKTS